MAKIKYGEGVTPLINKHYGYTFQPGRYGQVVMRSQPESRKRYPNQWKRQHNLMHAISVWQNFSSSEKTAWENFIAALPQNCKNADSGSLTAYENFIKRQQYQFLNYGQNADIINSPGLTEIIEDPLTYSLKQSGSELFLDYEFTNWTNDNIVSVYKSYPTSPGRKYQRTQPRYMGYIINELNKTIKFGKIYNHYAVQDARQITPSGWHIPSISEINTLVSNCGGSSVAGLHLKSANPAYWYDNPGLDTYGFDFRGEGRRQYSTGAFNSFLRNGQIWSSTIIYTSYAWLLQVQNSVDYPNTAFTAFNDGKALRYIKDDSTLSDCIGNDGTIYPAVKIGSQVWTTLNSIETQYRNGDSILNITDSSTWTSTSSGAWCCYNNDCTNSADYPSLPLSLNVTELYLHNFGFLPQPGQHVLALFIPMAISNGQFFPNIRETLEIQS